MEHNTKRKGWIKVHVAVDIESKKLVSLEITDERILQLSQRKRDIKTWDKDQKECSSWR
jgi:hypothetical protein